MHISDLPMLPSRSWVSAPSHRTVATGGMTTPPPVINQPSLTREAALHLVQSLAGGRDGLPAADCREGLASALRQSEVGFLLLTLKLRGPSGMQGVVSGSG